MQVVDANGNMFGYDHLEIIGADGKPKTTGGGGGTYVPYTGATGNVDLGEYELKAGQVEFDQTPTGTAGVAVMRWNDQDGTVDLGLKGGNVTLQIGQEQVTRVVNKTGSDLLEANYQAVRISGAQGNRLKVDLAQANNDANSADTIGIVTETILDNQEGFVTTSGLVRNIDTTGTLQGETWLDGNLLYLSGAIAGQITNIKPTAPIHTIIMGYVVRAHATQGQIYVKVDNGYELEELHNVTATDYSTPVDADSLLIYQSSESLWKRLTWANVKARLKTYFDTVYQAVLVSGTNIKTINGSSVLGSGDLVVSGGGGGGLSVPIPQVPTIGYMNGLINTNSTVPTQLNNMYLFPFIPMNDINTSYLTIQVTTAQAASTGKMVIYSSNIQGLPSSLLVQSTALDCSTTGFKTFMVYATFTANTKYWIGFVGSVANISVTSNSLAPVIGVRTNSNGTFNCLLFTIAYPTIPATLFAGSANFNNQTGCPRITFVF